MRLIFIAFFPLAFVACQQPETDCTTEARASVQVRVPDGEGQSIDDATVTYAVGEGNYQPCDSFVTGEWVCGWEVAGEITVLVEAEGFLTAEKRVTVEKDECHVETEFLEFELEADPTPTPEPTPPPGSIFDPGRQYYVQLIEDEDKCARSWELYGMNCYMTADFCADGRSVLMFTDILNDGTYRIDGETIVVTNDAGELQEEIVFVVSSETTLVDPWETTWTWDVGDMLTGNCR